MIIIKYNEITKFGLASTLCVFVSVCVCVIGSQVHGKLVAAATLPSGGGGGGAPASGESRDIETGRGKIHGPSPPPSLPFTYQPALYAVPTNLKQEKLNTGTDSVDGY